MESVLYGMLQLVLEMMEESRIAYCLSSKEGLAVCVLHRKWAPLLVSQPAPGEVGGSQEAACKYIAIGPS